MTSLEHNALIKHFPGLISVNSSECRRVPEPGYVAVLSGSGCVMIRDEDRRFTRSVFGFINAEFTCARCLRDSISRMVSDTRDSGLRVWWVSVHHDDVRDNVIGILFTGLAGELTSRLNTCKP